MSGLTTVRMERQSTSRESSTRMARVSGSGRLGLTPLVVDGQLLPEKKVLRCQPCSRRQREADQRDNIGQQGRGSWKDGEDSASFQYASVPI